MRPARVERVSSVPAAIWAAVLLVSAQVSADPSRGAGRGRAPPQVRPSADVTRSLPRRPQAKPPVTLVEVASRASGAAIDDVVDVLRREVEAELATIDWGGAEPRVRFSLSAAVVRLETAASDGGVRRATCTVSATLREASGGALLAIVEGRGRSEDAAILGAELGALSGAARGAVAALPEAIRRVSAKR